MFLDTQFQLSQSLFMLIIDLAHKTFLQASEAEVLELEAEEKGRGVTLLLQLAGSGRWSGSGYIGRQFKSNKFYKCSDAEFPLISK